MSNRSDILKKLMNISEQCSDRESDAIRSELSSENETVRIQSEASETEDSDEESTTDENENVINMPRKKCRMRIISDSGKETENTFQEVETVFLYSLVLSQSSRFD